MRIRRAPQVDCIEVVELVTNYLEGVLDRKTKRAVETHLRACPHCHEYLDQMRHTIAVLGRVPPETLSTRARSKLLAAFRDWNGPERA
jgi:predicted anti-sigma-YlaC factor YlaD